MIRNNLKVAFRTIRKNKVYSFVNILGLTIGLAACMLVATVVIDSLSYDQFWKRSDDLYKVNMYNTLADAHEKQASTPVGLGAVVKERFPELEHYAAINAHELRVKLKEVDQHAVSLSVIDGDSTLLEMLDFQFVSGDKFSFVAGQENIIITESFKETYFKGENPVGKFMYDGQGNDSPYFIAAVIKDIPQNTHLRAQAIVLRKPRVENLNKNGYGSYTRVYFMLKPGADAFSFSQKVNDWYNAYIENEDRRNVTFELQPIKDVYLNFDFDPDLTVKSSIRTVYIFGGVGILLLLIACINFVNLGTARVVKRLKEMAVRKVMGAGRGQLMGQFLTESMLFFGLSILLAYIIYVLSVPPMEHFLGRKLSVTLFSNWSMMVLTAICVLALSMTVGLYPAWLMSGFKPVSNLKGRIVDRSTFTTTWVRKALVVVQFSIAIVVLVALFSINQQLDYLSRKDIGYNRENLVYTGRQQWEGKQEAFKAELKKVSGVESLSIADWDPRIGIGTMSTTFDHPSKEGQQLTAELILADFDFPQTMGMKLQQGRFLDRQYGNDAYSMDSTMRMDGEQYKAYKDSRSVIATEYTARLLDADLGNTIKNVGYRTVGVVSDFHNKSLHEAFGPVLILAQEEARVGGMFIRIKAGTEEETLAAIDDLWKRFFPNKILAAQWVSDILAHQYEAEQKQRTLFLFFSNLMLFVSGLGVFGLIVHAAEQRTKEISIRKVLGASVAGIVKMLSGDFVKLVLVAILIASPIAWWAVSLWLEDFAFRIQVQWWMFATAGLLTAFIALFTVAFHAVKTAIANPVESLRDE